MRNANDRSIKWIATGRPFVIAKCGMSLDGRLTRRRRTTMDHERGGAAARA